ncbi:MAG TPA: RNA polymerase factor sigma-54 [Hyphomicrobiaceae bacterium]|nr:RNA polymerase factor sigma-54 [Hyphomicrobiaceae bacterium]
MALATRLELRQGQQLVMTPQLQQAIRLLQLSNLELVQFVEAELEKNPLLERDDDSGSARDVEPATEPAEANSSGDEAPDPPSLEPTFDGDAASACDTDFENAYPDATRGDAATDPVQMLAGSSWSNVGPGGGDDDQSLEDYLSETPTLKDHLLGQMLLSSLDPVQGLIAQHLLDQLNDVGYLDADIAEIAERLAAPVPLVESVLERLQKLDPPGVFARSLAECLALQLKEQRRYDPMIAKVLDNLPLLASHNLQALRRAVDCEMSELVEMISEIKRLNPRPGAGFGASPVQTVVPDVIVRPGAHGSWIVELNTETLPRVLVNRSYFSLVSKTARHDKDKDYITECLQNANWLVKSLDQRARTILRVAEEIVRQQDGFFAHGVQHLRPLNLKTVADAIKMHESTVSRVTSNKYMATSRGIFELKYFFTSAIAAAGEGDAHSSEAVRHRIRQLIDAETAANVLSDDRIVELLGREGIDIARRTVAKYREGMRIASSVQRRRQKKLAERTAMAS